MERSCEASLLARNRLSVVDMSAKRERDGIIEYDDESYDGGRPRAGLDARDRNELDVPRSASRVVDPYSDDELRSDELGR